MAPRFCERRATRHLGCGKPRNHRDFEGWMSESLTFLQFLKHLALNVFKNIVFLKVQARNFDRGRSFRSAERSNTIGVIQNAPPVSNTSVGLWGFGSFFTTDSQHVGFPSVCLLLVCEHNSVPLFFEANLV